MEDVFHHLNNLANLSLGQVPRYVINELTKRKLSWSIDMAGNIVCRKGNPNRGLVSHMDFVVGSNQVFYTAATNVATVMVAGKPKRVTIDGKKVEAPPEVPKYGFRCVGGDDKVGVAINLVLLDNFDNLFVLFTEDEELGCEGAKNFDLKNLEGIEFLIESDRRGIVDVVNNVMGSELCSNEFLDAVLNLDKSRVKSYGLSTDVGELRSRGWKGNCVNLSCGYYNPHTPACYIVPQQVLDTYSFVKRILINMPVNMPLPRELPKNAWYGDMWGWDGYGEDFFNANSKEEHFREFSSSQKDKEKTEEDLWAILEDAFEGSDLEADDFLEFKLKFCPSTSANCENCIADGALASCIAEFKELVIDMKIQMEAKEKEKAINKDKPEDKAVSQDPNYSA